MIRNISRLKLKSFNSLNAPPKGSQFQVPRVVALALYESLYGSNSIELYDSNNELEHVINTAYENGLFSYKITIV